MGGWLTALLNLLGMGGGPVAGPVSAAPPGGVFRRSLPTWVRAFGRAPDTQRRTLARSLPTLARVWRYSPMALATEGAALIAAESDDREYGFDLSRCPEIVGGLTIASGVIAGGTGLTIGTVSVLAADFDGIPSGKGLKVRISGGTAGTTYNLACKATLSNGRVVVVPGRLAKVRDYDA
jgi:hypothetical protein